jgi:hypothetical protein
MCTSLRCAQCVGQRADTRALGGTDRNGAIGNRASAQAHCRKRSIPPAPLGGGRRVNDRVYAHRYAWGTLSSAVERRLRGGRRAAI